MVTISTLKNLPGIAEHRHPDISYAPAAPALKKGHRAVLSHVSNSVREWNLIESETQAGILKYKDFNIYVIARDTLNEGKRYVWGYTDKKGIPVIVPNCLSAARIWYEKAKFLPHHPNRHTKDKVAVLGYSYNQNYCNWLLGIVADWWFFKQNGFTEKDFDWFLFPGGGKNFQREALDLIGVNPDKRLPVETFGKKTSLDIFKARKPFENAEMRSWVAQAMQDELLYADIAETGSKKIYISRGDAPRRQVVNEDEIIEHLKSRDFEIHLLTGLSLKQQQHLFANARAVIAPHGAALTNLLWCPSNARIVDIFPANKNSATFKLLAHQKNLPYLALETDAVAHSNTHANWSDLEIGDDVLQQALDFVD